MKHFGIDLAEGADILNLTVDSGPQFPLTPSLGELFFRSDTLRMSVYDGAMWNVVSPEAVISVACSDETTPLTTGLKVTFNMPYRMWLKDVRLGLTTPVLQDPVVVDISHSGSAIFSTPASIVAYSSTGYSSHVIVQNILQDDAQITITVSATDAAATGLKVHLIGYVQEAPPPPPPGDGGDIF